MLDCSSPIEFGFTRQGPVNHRVMMSCEQVVLRKI